VRAFVDEADQAKVETIYDEAIQREVARVAQIVPHGELAIQFDVASAVFFLLETGKPTRYGNTKDEMLSAFAAQMIALGNAVPADVDLIYHLCYGDNQHKHSIEPTDTADMVELTNRISRGLTRPIALFHMPVPRNRGDDAYFAPLKDLKLHPETKLSLGLVHHTDGLAGTRARIAAAAKVRPDFMVATECGFGRRDPKTIPELLRIHAEAATA
jgi:methionine synthase II (cobalamin-independent)